MKQAFRKSWGGRISVSVRVCGKGVGKVCGKGVGKVCGKGVGKGCYLWQEGVNFGKRMSILVRGCQFW